MSFLETAKRYFSLVELIFKVQQSLDVDSIRRKYNLTKNRRVCIYVGDADKYYKFKMTEKGIQPIFEMPGIKASVDINVSIPELCTFKHLRAGTKAGYDPATNTLIPMRYTPWTAWRMGDISTSGDSSTNDLICFMDVFTELMANIPVEHVNKIIGMCSHEV